MFYCSDEAALANSTFQAGIFDHLRFHASEFRIEQLVGRAAKDCSLANYCQFYFVVDAQAVA